LDGVIILLDSHQIQYFTVTKVNTSKVGDIVGTVPPPLYSTVHALDAINDLLHRIIQLAIRRMSLGGKTQTEEPESLGGYYSIDILTKSSFSVSTLIMNSKMAGCWDRISAAFSTLTSLESIADTGREDTLVERYNCKPHCVPTAILYIAIAVVESVAALKILGRTPPA
jgi:hypothetical protein